MTCPECGSNKFRVAHAHSFGDKVAQFFGFYPMRCGSCKARFNARIWNWANIIWAKCDRCHRMDLSRWSPSRYMAPLKTRVALTFGARAVRCEYCRNNFASFRPVREEFSRSKRNDRSLARETPTAAELAITMGPARLQLPAPEPAKHRYEPAPPNVYHEPPTRPVTGPLSTRQSWRDSSTEYRREVVLRMLRGESVNDLSRELSIPGEVLQEWLSTSLAGIDDRLEGRHETRPAPARPRFGGFRRMG